MTINLKHNFYENILLLLALLVMPISVLAPLGTWVPLILSSFIIVLAKSYLYFKIKVDKIIIILSLIFLWILVSITFINNSFDNLSKLLQIVIIFFSGIAYIKSSESFSELKKKSIFLLAGSFILSALIIIIDYKYKLGLKLWLSRNFDFNNFENFYSLKEWIGLEYFLNNNAKVIDYYLDNTYDRGLTSLSILSFPLAAICYLYKQKFLAYIIMLLCLIALLSFYNLAALIVFLFSNILLLFFCLSKKLFKNTFLLFIGCYLFAAPFMLGNLNYRNFAFYEKEITEKQYIIDDKYPRPIVSKACDSNYKKTVEKNNKYCDVKSPPQVMLEEFLKAEKKTSIFLDFIFYQKLYLDSKLIHRKIIWSFSKENILKEPLFGNGFYSSRKLGESNEITNIENNKLSAIPLHPHNVTIQIWLELGLIGIILYFILLISLVNKISTYSKQNFNYSAISMVSLFQVFLITQLSYGLWQIWWLAMLFFCFFLNSLIFIRLSSKKVTKI